MIRTPWAVPTRHKRLRLFASRMRSGAYVARILAVGGMYSMFFFLTQFLQGVRGYSPLEAGVAFLPMTLVIFGLVRVVPRVAARIGDMPLLVGGLSLALVGAGWLSQLDAGTAFFPGIGVPLMIMGLGMGSALVDNRLVLAGDFDVIEERARRLSRLVTRLQVSPAPAS